MDTPNAFATTILVASLMGATPASAAPATRYLFDQGGPACQLSVPTISSKVRPRANGMRNEGTANEFVICQYSRNGGGSFKYVSISVSTFDGIDHAIQCTAMTGDVANGTSYSSKNFSTGTNPNWYGFAQWVPSDFGQAGTAFVNSTASVTCILPPGASIILVAASYDEDVGA
ncbi:hypothetical protein FNZ56_08780 [Pseudoluteimonas lycopersici]|uniref:Spore coat protein U domain-containing protein n=1 Tax=Pseudoluteimonas lycopersici TaxID=1324796 RepID=A0A516V613_9GAMM|nr:hypothetical protein [Lysobacter lycopersici]QDQ73963.1 hypothetical protein FNZ56_08780 [Lysobacter lycopersici]